ncbi:MAG TPA: succinate dehydrogenase/fumarate reductase iron-sulfur subunit [Opitutaceae bacterium]
MGDETIRLDVHRYHPERDQRPHIQSFDVPYHEDWVVLDALNHLKNEVDGTLTFRWSCRMGVCGSCGMMVNGEPKLTCATFLRDYWPQAIRVEPLANFPVERDLVNRIDDFMTKLSAVKPWLIPSKTKPSETGEFLQTPAQLASYKQFSMCINCLLCYAACPVVGLSPQFLGPAAIALAKRYNNDSRDAGRREREEVVNTHHGEWDCTFVGECSVVCPKDVDPAGAIQQMKLDSMLSWYRRWLTPWQGRG